MYVIFVHVTGIAIVEILFYFLYVGPIESNVFENLMKGIVNREIKDNKLELLSNFSEFSFDDDNLIDEISSNKEYGEKRRHSHNKELYNEAMQYWGYLLLTTFIVSLFQLVIYLYYNKYNKRKIITVDSEQSLELMNIRIRNESVSSDDINFLHNDSDSNEPIDDLEANENDKFIIIKKKLTWKYIFKKIFYYSFFIGLLLAFEFGFFQLIVFNYMPLSSEEVEYIVYKAIYDHF